MTENIFLFCICCYLWWFSLCHFVFQTWHLFYTVPTYRFSVSSSSNLVIICVSVCVFCDLSSCQLVDYIIPINFLDLSSDLHLSSRDYINLNVIISCVLLHVIHWVFQVLNLLFQILVFPGNVGTTFCKLVNSRSSTEGQFLQHWFQMKAKELVVSMCQFLWRHCH